MILSLRYYQSESVAAAWDFIRAHASANPLVVLPTGGGKTLVIAQICQDVIRWEGRCLVTAHVKELLQQAHSKLAAMCPGIDVGLYSAGLGKRQTGFPVTVGGIQSIYKKATDIGFVDIMVVDEAHLISDNEASMYQTLIRGLREINPQMRIIGLTATPYRLDSGLICGEDRIFQQICYEVSVKRLIDEGYLSRLISQAGTKTDITGVKIRAGEYLPGELEGAFNKPSVVLQACKEIIAAVDATGRRSVLVFTCGTSHCLQVTRTLKVLGCDVEYLTGETAPEDRERLLREFKAGSLKYLVNINVLTTGFDAPNVDCVAMLRSTLSPGLYYQIVGRGLRLNPGKADCLILDFGGNVERHGPIDQIKTKEQRKAEEEALAPKKTCPECEAEVPISTRFCVCGHVFDINAKDPHNPQAGTQGVVSGQVTVTEYEVRDITYRPHAKRGADADAPKTLRVDYQVALNVFISEWVCVEHPEGFALGKARTWWRKRSSNPMPALASEAAEIADAGGVWRASRITVKEVSGNKFPTITDYKFAGDKPGPVSTERDDSFEQAAQAIEHGEAYDEFQPAEIDDNGWGEVPF